MKRTQKASRKLMKTANEYADSEITQRLISRTHDPEPHITAGLQHLTQCLWDSGGGFIRLFLIPEKRLKTTVGREFEWYCRTRCGKTSHLTSVFLLCLLLVQLNSKPVHREMLENELYKTPNHNISECNAQGAKRSCTNHWDRETSFISSC